MTSPTPSTVPGPAVIVSSVKTTEGAVSFSVSAIAGSTATVGFTVTCSSPGATTRTATAAASPVIVLGLESDKTYSCSATANNSEGVGTAGPAYSLILPRISAEGLWAGTTSQGGQIIGVVLENGENWFFSAKGAVLNAAWQGSGNSLTGKYTASNEVFFSSAVGVNNGAALIVPFMSDRTRRQRNSVNSAAAVMVPFSGDYTPMKTFNGSIAIPNQPKLVFSANYDPAYDKPARLNAIVGTWKTGVGTASTNLTVGANGAIAGSTGPSGSGGCTFSGSINPRPSGKNVYTVKLTAGGSPCLYSGLVTEGIGLVSTDATGVATLLLSVLDSTRGFDKGFVAALSR